MSRDEQDLEDAAVEEELAKARTQLQLAVRATKVISNTNQHVIVITRDRLKLRLSDFERAVGRQTAWVAPLGLVLTISLTLTSATFNDFLLPPDTWRAIFVLADGLAVAWLLFTMYAAFQSWKSGEGTADKLLDELSKQEQE